MIFDVVACIPINLIEGLVETGKDESQEDVKYNNFIRLLRLPRLYRIVRMSKLFKVLKLSKNSQFQKIFDFLSLR